MIQFYIRLFEGAPSLVDQIRSIEQSGFSYSEVADHLWVDTLDPEAKAIYPELTKLFERLQRGDRLVVALPMILGRSKRQVFDVMKVIWQRGAHVFDASIGQLIPWSEDVQVAMDFCSRAETDSRKILLKEARQSRARLGNKGGVKPRLTEKEVSRALSTWQNTKYTAAEAAQKIGVSVSTAYRLLGARTPALDDGKA